jgi:hypothetical protein
MSSLNHSTHASEGSIWEHSIPRMGSCLVLCCVYMADCQKPAASQRKFTQLVIVNKSTGEET